MHLGMEILPYTSLPSRECSKSGKLLAIFLYRDGDRVVCWGMAANLPKTSKRSLNPLTVVLVSGGVLLVLLVIGLLVVKTSLNGWLQGDGFREWLARRAEIALKSEVTVGELEWSGSEVFAAKVTATGRPEAAFSELVLDGVRTKTGGLRDRAFLVPDITVNRLNLLFSSTRKAAPVAEFTSETESAGEAPKFPRWLADLTPNRVEIDRIHIATANVAVEKVAGTVFTLAGVETTMEPDFSTDVWEISGKGGTMQVPDQPQIRLKELGMRWRGSELFVDRCALGIYKDGHIEGRGEIGFENGGIFDVDLDISSITIDELISGEWQDRLDGVIHGPVHITGSPGGFAYEGTLNVTEGVIESIPVLELVARYTRSDRFKRIVLNEAKTDFKSDGWRIELRNLVLQSDGLLRVEGSIDIVGDQLDGDLRVGVVPGTMRWIPGAERLVFVEDRDGFRWAPLRLTGTTAEPKEDLSARLIGAAGESLLGELPDGLRETAEELLVPGEGSDPSDKLLEQGKKVLDLLSPFLQGR